MADYTGLSFRATLPLVCQHFCPLSPLTQWWLLTLWLFFLMSTGRYLVAAVRLFFFVFHSGVLIQCAALMFQGPFRLRGKKDCSDLLAMVLNGLSVWIQAHISIFSQWRCIQPISTCIGWSAPLCDALRHVTLQPCSHCVPPSVLQRRHLLGSRLEGERPLRACAARLTSGWIIWAGIYCRKVHPKLCLCSFSTSSALT